MKTQRLNIRWIRFWMAALSAGALAGEGCSSDGRRMSGEDAGGSTGEDAGGSTGEDAGGSTSEDAGGSTSEGGAAGSTSDPGATEVEWSSVAGGSLPGGDGSGTPCGDVEAVLLHDQAELDQWTSDHGIAHRESMYFVDWTTELLLGAVTQCSTSSHVVNGGDLATDGGGGLTAEFTLTHVVPSFAVSTTVWALFSVEGRAWTGVSATTIE